MCLENCALFALFGFPGHLEMLIVAFIALLLFGNRLPGVMRSLGRGIVEFKKGVKGIEDDVEESSKITQDQE
ncbi:MAG: twin-arginine translocase TatA/TatE family subunit [Pirellulaceae bacterium]